MFGIRWDKLIATVVGFFLTFFLLSLLFMIAQNFSFAQKSQDIFIDVFNNADVETQKAALSQLSDKCERILYTGAEPQQLEKPCRRFVSGFRSNKHDFAALFLEVYPQANIVSGKGWRMRFDEHRTVAIIANIVVLGLLFVSLYLAYERNDIHYLSHLARILEVIGIILLIFPLGVLIYAKLFPPNTSVYLNRIIEDVGAHGVGTFTEMVLPLIFTHLFPLILFFIGALLIAAGVITKKRLKSAYQVPSLDSDTEHPPEY